LNSPFSPTKVLPEELDLLELLLSPPPEEDGVVAVPELEDWFPPVPEDELASVPPDEDISVLELLVPPSSPPLCSPQERVNVMASKKPAANAIFENCVLIVLPP
jgi:hypothetical protein